MSISKRYFQLTPEILLEYNYTNINKNGTIEQEGNREYIIDLYENGKTLASIVKSKYNNSSNFLYDNYSSHFVLPTNSSESRFIQCINGDNCVWDNINLKENISKNDIFYDINGDNKIDPSETIKTENTSDILFDRFKLHFTSRNYMGEYDGIILTVNVYDKIKNKVSLMSYYIKKTDDVELNSSPMLINQKLYTTYLGDFEIPSTYGLLSCTLAGENVVRHSFTGYDLMVSTPMIFSIYGVKSTIEKMGFDIYTVEKLNSVYVPIQDKFDAVNVSITKSNDGDYFEIIPKVSGDTSFSDYIYNLSDGRPELYIIFHDLTLTEHCVNNLNNPVDKVTHREQYIVNAGLVNDDGTMVADEDSLETPMYYRPIIMNSTTVSFTIRDQMKILNTLDNTTIVKESTLDYGTKPNENVNRFGKKMNRIYLGEVPTQVNVYNKRPDIDTDSIKITNGGSNVTIENHQHSITSFIESANIGVSIEQVSLEDIN